MELDFMTKIIMRLLGRLNVIRTHWMSVDLMEFQVVEERARIFDLHHHVVGRLSSRWSESKTPAPPSTKWERALQSLTSKMWLKFSAHDLQTKTQRYDLIVCKTWNQKGWHFKVQDIIQGHSQYFILCLTWHVTAGIYRTHWGLRNISYD